MDILFAPYFALFLIIILGLLIGRIKIRGISLDISAVLFVAMAYGYFGLEMPADLKNIGLVLFIFTIGFQSGPAFFETFKKEGKKLVILTVLIVVSSAAVALTCGMLLGYSPALTGGLFTGGITSTPGLATITELSNSGEATIGYGIAYPFGVVGVVLFVKLFPRLFKMDIKKAEEKDEAENLEKYPKVISRNFIVENPEVIGKQISELNIRENTGVDISRIFQGGMAFTPNPQTILFSGSIIKAVGTEADLLKVQNLIGTPTDVEIVLNENYDIKFVVVTNKKVLGKTTRELGLQSKYNVVVTRIRRSGVDFSVSSNLKLQFGDKIKIAGIKEDVNKVVEFLGNEASKVHEANYLPVAVGIVLGVLLGQISIKIGKFDFSLGLTGGVIIVAIILSRIRKIGPVVFSLTTVASQILRQIGLLLFLIGVGTEAGSSIVPMLKTSGVSLFLSGVLITMAPMILAVILGKYILKIDILQLLGGIPGGMTSTPGLAAASSMTKTNAPGIAYATIYPIGMIMVIICVQIMFWIMA